MSPLASDLAVHVQALRFAVRSHIMSVRGLWGLYTLVHPDLRAIRITHRTQLVIDGFPRSANSYARAWFMLANPGVQSVASHLHTPRSVLSATARGLPTVVLFRDPRAAVNSATHYLPAVGSGSLLREWIRFYEGLVRLENKAIFADFERVTANFATVVRACNDQFGTSFSAVAPPDVERKIGKELEDVARQRHAPGRVAFVVSYPSPARQSANDLDADPVFKAELPAAQALFDKLRRISAKQFANYAS